VVVAQRALLSRSVRPGPGAESPAQVRPFQKTKAEGGEAPKQQPQGEQPKLEFLDLDEKVPKGPGGGPPRLFMLTVATARSRRELDGGGG